MRYKIAGRFRSCVPSSRGRGVATIIAMFATGVVLLGVVTPALGQRQGQGREGGVPDVLTGVLTDVLRLSRSVHGHVVQHREATLVLRGGDDRTYTINTVGLETTALRNLREGWPVIVVLKSPGPDSMPIAASVAPGEGAVKVFRRVKGTVESVSGDRITFKTRGGMTVTLDRSRIVGEAPHVAPNESATLVYEQEPQLAGVWIATGEGQPSAAPGPRS
jgi:hypothetical protein